MILYLPGAGEKGVDLKSQFRQRTIFEKVCSPEFQTRHPCYFVALSPPRAAGTLLGGSRECPTPAQRLLMEALQEICTQCTKPKVDRSRIYATGLSFGGNGVYALAFNYPDVFAAIVPVASLIMPPAMIPEDAPLSVWHLYNGTDYRSRGIDEDRLDVFREAFQRQCGEFCVGTYPDAGHNAWDKAWREDFLWDWLFTKTNDAERNRRLASSKRSVVRSLQKASCTASQEPCAADYGVACATDGLQKTCCRSAGPMNKGDWLRVEFVRPVNGAVTVATGTEDGRDIPPPPILH